MLSPDLFSHLFHGGLGTLTSPSFTFHENHMGECPQKQMRWMPGMPPAVRAVRVQSWLPGSPEMWAVGAEVQAGQVHLTARLPVIVAPLSALELAQWPCPSVGPSPPGTPRVSPVAGPESSLHLSSHKPDVKGAGGLDVMPPVIDLRQVGLLPPG